MRVLVLAASPREDGNSRLMADALLEGPLRPDTRLSWWISIAK
jgi:hypothetical protein